MSFYQIQEALSRESVDDLKKALNITSQQVDTKNFTGQTPLTEFLNRKIKLNVTDMRLVLLLLGAGTNIDMSDYHGLTARQLLAKLGYRVDRKYLTISQKEVSRLNAMAKAEDPNMFDIYG